MIVCVCNNISESELRQAINGGADRLSTLRNATGLGTNCGGCLPVAKSILENQLSEMIAANPDLFYAA